MNQDLKNTLRSIGTVREKDVFFNSCISLIQDLSTRYNRSELIECLESEKLNKVEIKIIVESCFLTNQNDLFLRINELINSNTKENDFKNALDWFKSSECYEQVFCPRIEDHEIDDLSDFFERFTMEILPSINHKKYGTIYTYIASGNMEKDVSENLYRELESDAYLPEIVLGNANNYLVPMKMVSYEFNKYEVVVEDNFVDQTDLSDVLEDSFIDIVMISANREDLYVSNLTTNTSSYTIYELFDQRIKYSEALTSFSKSKGYNLIQCDFFKPEMVKGTDRFDSVDNLLAEKLFYYCNVFPHKIDKLLNNNNYQIIMMGSSFESDIHQSENVYKEFNNFIDLVIRLNDAITIDLKHLLQDRLKLNAKLIYRIMRTECTEEGVNKFKSIIDESNLLSVSVNFQVDELNEVVFMLRYPTEILAEMNLKLSDM